MSGWWKALREYWDENGEIELSIMPSLWPVPVFILAFMIWDIATRETTVPWQLWAGFVSQIAFLTWLLWLRFFRARS